MFGKLLNEATRLTRGGRLIDATAAIQRVLGQARSTPLAAAPGEAIVLDDCVREIPPLRPARGGLGAEMREPGRTGAEVPEPGRARPVPGAPAAGFTQNAYAGRTGTRDYKLFVPAGHLDKPLPLIVMLHGCTQSPDDFAAGTRMNELAQQRGFLVLYPAQAARSNSSKCWNWFVPGDQRRGGGEPELLAGMTRHIIATHAVDPARVYIAGLSAGGAMADIMGREYPELYAAVGIHSGLPQGAAHDVGSAFAAMQGGASPGREEESRASRAAPPAIVFHGDRDATVHPSNGAQLIDALLATGTGADDVVATSDKSAAGGRQVTRTVHRRLGAAEGEPSLAEHWLVHGAAHAWSGGSPAGSYTETAGPDASREMIRFFEAHPLRAG